MRPFRYARPTTIAELLGLLSTHGSAARLLAGGTDLLVRLRLGHIAPDVVIDARRVGFVTGPGRTVLNGAEIVTSIEGLPADDRLDPVQEAFLDQGAGEGGILGIAAAVGAAINEAAGVPIRDLPLTPERVWPDIRDRDRAQAQHKTGVEAADASPLESPR
jgi:hypothetical protein